MPATQQWPSLSDLDDESPLGSASGTADAAAGTLETPSELLLRGVRVAKAGRLGEAAEIIAQSIVKDPTSADAYEALATVLIPLGKLEFATRAKAKAIELGYGSAADWEMLGDMLFRIGQFNDAAEAFEIACQLQPGSAETERKLRSAKSYGGPLAELPGSEVVMDGIAAMPSSPNSDAIPAAWRVVNLITIEPANNPHAAAFNDVTLSFEQALRSLGIAVRTHKNAIGIEGINLLFGGHLIASQEFADKIPQNTVVVNLEQLAGFNVRAQPTYLSLLKRLAVWDYSARNIAALRELASNPNVHHFRIGYTPQMTRHLPTASQATDVLFYGSLNARRTAVLQALRRAGLKVNHLFSVYGPERDLAIADAKVVLNLHFYEDSIHEIVRTSYLLANSKAVVSECGPRTEIDDDIKEALVAVPYRDIIETCVDLVRDEPRRRDIERRGFEIFAKRDQASILRDTIRSTVLPALA
jgi:hypothetical protein